MWCPATTANSSGSQQHCPRFARKFLKAKRARSPLVDEELICASTRLVNPFRPRLAYRLVEHAVWTTFGAGCHRVVVAGDCDVQVGLRFIYLAHLNSS